MIIQTGTAIFQESLLRNSIKVIFPLTESSISYETLSAEHEGLKGRKIKTIYGYRVNLISHINLLFPQRYNDITGTPLIYELQRLSKILKKKEEFLYMPRCIPIYGAYRITAGDIEENRAYKVSIEEDIDINNIVKHLESSGQKFDINMKSLNIIKITDTMFQLGYGVKGYDALPYGN